VNDSTLRAELLTWANVLNRRTGTVPAVDVAWKLRQLAGATPTTDPAPAPEQTNPAQADSSGTVPQRFPVADMQTNAGPAPAAADGEVRALLVHPAAWNGLVAWLTSRGLTVDSVGDLEDIPTYSMGIGDELAAAAPRAPRADLAGLAAREDAATPAEPMAECGYHTAAAAPFSIRHELCGTPYARGQDTAEDDDYGDDIGGWNRTDAPRPSAPAVDGDTPIPSEEA
jgi:hypothetical protein